MLLLLAIALTWLSDRAPPMQVLRYVEPAPARPGTAVVFAMPVARQTERDCSVQVDRFLIDSTGTKYELSRTDISDKGLDLIEARMGSFLRVAIVIPPGVAPGQAVVGSEWRWQCNPVHSRWPIRMSGAWPIQVLPDAAHAVNSAGAQP